MVHAPFMPAIPTAPIISSFGGEVRGLVDEGDRGSGVPLLFVPRAFVLLPPLAVWWGEMVGEMVQNKFSRFNVCFNVCFAENKSSWSKHGTFFWCLR